MLPKSPVLGSLRYFEIYSQFDGPKCFSVINNNGQLFLAYWAGFKKDENKDHWFYVSVSEKTLDALKRETISVRDVFLKTELNPLLVKTCCDKLNELDDVDFLGLNAIAGMNIPPKEYFLDPDEVESIEKSSKWLFELNISKNAQKHSFPYGDSVNRILESLTDMIDSFMRVGTREKPSLYPMSAVEGSFELKMGATDEKKAINALIAISESINANEKIAEFAKDRSLDPVKLKDFIDVINNSNVSVTLTPKTFSILEHPIIIKGKALKSLVQQLGSSTSVFIDSTLVPQANDINKVIEVVNIRARGERLEHENIEGLSSDRQIKYYTDAAYCLGLMKKNLTVTPSGYFLASRQDERSRYEVLADRFESSEFGWAWMKWSSVSAMRDLSPETAEVFLNECVPGLSQDTAKRRATTLVIWLNTLSEYRRSYQQNKQNIDIVDEYKNENLIETS